jgi:DNA-binding beta-propeller fold protein YncE
MEMGKRIIGTRAATILAACMLFTIVGCGSNSTPVGIVVTPTTPTVTLKGTQQFSATVTGSASNTVTWQICLPPNTVGTQPTVCDPVVTGTKLAQTQLPAGYGTITSGANGIGGGLYTAPATAPPTNHFFVVATSTQDLTAFGTAIVNVSTGVVVRVTPDTAAVGTGEHYQFTANVSGASNTGVTWSVTAAGGAPIVGGNSTTGYICPSPNITVPCTPGEYFAPTTSPGAVTITATSSFDPSASGTASVTVSSATIPTVTAIQPNLVSEGSVQQDVYITGTNFLTTSTAMVGTPPTAVPTLYISATLIRATIPAGPFQAAGAVPLFIATQNGDASNTLPGDLGLTVNPTRPAIVAALPRTLAQTLTATNINLVGGFFSPSSTVQINGQAVGATLTSSQQLTVPVPANALPVPGSYPVIVRNADVVAPAPSISAINLAVEPVASTIPTAPQSSVSVGSKPQSIAIDPSLGVAVIANSGDDSVSVINLATNANVPGSPVPLPSGSVPTGIAVDDQLPHHIAVVANSGNNSVAAIDLTTLAVTPLTLPNPNAPPLAAPIPYSIGIDSMSHQAIVALQSANFAWIVDFSTGVPGANPVQIGGALTPFSTGLNPAVAVDQKLNWAVVTPGGLGVVNVVELGRLAGTGGNVADLGRPPSVVAALTASTTIQGVGINQQTHTALLADPTGPTDTFVSPSLSSFSLMDQSIASVPFTQNNLPFDQIGLIASGVNSLSNIGIAVNSGASNGYVVDMQNNTVLQTLGGLNEPVAVAVDEALNKAYVVNQGNNTVSVVSLGTTFNPLQITRTNPSFTLVQPTPVPITLTVTGSGFTAGSAVYLDGTAVASTLVNSRELSATVPAGDLTGPRRFIVYVKNGTAISNVSDLTVVQPVNVGINPIGVAIDPDLDQAVVTNSSSNSISVINLLNGETITPQAPSFFSTGTAPVGVAVFPRAGLAVVTNNGSNNVTILDERGVSGTFSAPATVALCGTNCTAPLGVAVDSDSGQAQVVGSYCAPNATGSGCNPEGGLNSMAANLSTTAASIQGIDLGSVAVAMDPTLTFAGIAIAGQPSELQIFSVGPNVSPGQVNNLQLPTGVFFDPVNQDFLVANSTVNTVVVVDPATAVVLGSLRTGINPTSLDYNYNTSTLVTSNAATNTISILNYVCPPNPNGINSCPVTNVQDVVAVGTPPPSSSVVVGPNSIAIDPRLNLAVQVDQINNRVLLVPLPQ